MAINPDQTAYVWKALVSLYALEAAGALGKKHISKDKQDLMLHRQVTRKVRT